MWPNCGQPDQCEELHEMLQHLPELEALHLISGKAIALDSTYPKLRYFHLEAKLLPEATSTDSPVTSTFLQRHPNLEVLYINTTTRFAIGDNDLPKLRAMSINERISMPPASRRVVFRRHMVAWSFRDLTIRHLAKHSPYIRAAHVKYIWIRSAYNFLTDLPVWSDALENLFPHVTELKFTVYYNELWEHPEDDPNVLAAVFVSPSTGYQSQRDT